MKSICAFWKEATMDTKLDDRVYHQIEKKLSDSISDNLFATGNILEESKELIANEVTMKEPPYLKEELPVNTNNSYENSEYSSSSIPLSREEYIRQAREACLRQLNSLSNMGKYSSGINEEQVLGNISHQKKSIISKDPLGNAIVKYNDSSYESEQEIASFRSLVIRIVCAFVLFLSVFIIDKFNITIGNLNPIVVREYITGIDYLETLETFVVTLFK